jgi:hypothetical protein
VVLQHPAEQPGQDVTARLFGGFPPEDLATAGRVLAIVTTRANAELAGPEL